MAELTDEQIKAEQKFLEGVPRLNIGAFVLPAIWGPVHGMWVSILFYPLWIFVDNVIYAAYQEPTLLTVGLAVVMAAFMVALSLAFSLVSQPFALHRAVNAGKTKEEYLKRQRVWAVVCVVLAALVLILATYYNLEIRPTMVEA